LKVPLARLPFENVAGTVGPLQVKVEYSRQECGKIYDGWVQPEQAGREVTDTNHS
jgi:hypothetical protein